jgi:hypothetical protein
VIQVECGLASLQLTFLPILLWLANEKAIMHNKTRCEANKYDVSHSRWTSHVSLCLTVLLRLIILRTKAGVYVVLPICGSSSRRVANKSKLCVISGFCREADEICALLGYYAEESRSYLHTASHRFSN